MLSASLFRRARRGTTLVELLVVLTIFGLIGSVIMRVLIRQQRFYSRAAEITTMHGNTREIAALLPSDLRGLSSGGGDIYAMSDSSIDFRIPTGSSVICKIGIGLVTIPPTTTASRSSVTSWMSAPQLGDSVLIYDEGATTSVTDDGWNRYRVTAALAAGSCPNTTGFTATSAEAAAGYTLTLSASPPATSPAGSVIRFFRHAHYSFYRTSNGDSYLGYYDCPGGTCSSITPVSGPFKPYAASGSGIQFVYYDSTGAVTTIPANVARIDVTVRATTNPVSLGDAARVAYVDSLVFSTALRNRK
ncbi:MAG: type II secretion system protein [Gemmatimonadaceae bacterium]|nr:type II secretion system protein [Gemmatimonadaceae bacterium]NUQ91751.1 type II secretion system protein [Gemmatimonadaceae bacterium]NUR20245.1 type II secretion system protein [Gemmatimonadaceae bacterium]NUS98201.1 type II secretion system protein [Gemmatimonadaceae bacterium]